MAAAEEAEELFVQCRFEEASELARRILLEEEASWRPDTEGAEAPRKVKPRL
jgi:hypothetical protein